jgi:hypothetical protein
MKLIPLLNLNLRDEYIKTLQQFNVRFIEQLAPIAATFEGKFALANVLGLKVDGEEFRILLQKIESYVNSEHGLSLGRPRDISSSTGYALTPHRRHGLGYFIPELQGIQFGEPLPPSLGAGRKGSGPATTIGSKLVNVTPVRNQYFRGTCTAFSAVAVLEADFLRRNERDIDLSEQYLWFRTREFARSAETEGTTLQTVYEALQRYGTCEKAFWPYERYNDWGQSSLFLIHGHSLSELDTEASHYRIQSYRSISPASIADIKKALSNGQLVSIGVPIFRDSWDNNGLVETEGEIALPLTRLDPVTGREILLDVLVGGHALAIAGYEDTPDPNNFGDYRPGGGFFIVKNSWGTQWAWQNPRGPGFGQLPYEYIVKYNYEAYTVT